MRQILPNVTPAESQAPAEKPSQEQVGLITTIGLPQMPPETEREWAMNILSKVREFIQAPQEGSISKFFSDAIKTVDWRKCTPEQKLIVEEATSLLSRLENFSSRLLERFISIPQNTELVERNGESRAFLRQAVKNDLENLQQIEREIRVALSAVQIRDENSLVDRAGKVVSQGLPSEVSTQIKKKWKFHWPDLSELVKFAKASGQVMLSLLLSPLTLSAMLAKKIASKLKSKNEGSCGSKTFKSRSHSNGGISATKRSFSGLKGSRNIDFARGRQASGRSFSGKIEAHDKAYFDRLGVEAAYVVTSRDGKLVQLEQFLKDLPATAAHRSGAEIAQDLFKKKGVPFRAKAPDKQELAATCTFDVDPNQSEFVVPLSPRDTVVALEFEFSKEVPRDSLDEAILILMRQSRKAYEMPAELKAWPIEEGVFGGCRFKLPTGLAKVTVHIAHRKNLKPIISSALAAELNAALYQAQVYNPPAQHRAKELILETTDRMDQRAQIWFELEERSQIQYTTNPQIADLLESAGESFDAAITGLGMGTCDPLATHLAMHFRSLGVASVVVSGSVPDAQEQAYDSLVGHSQTAILAENGVEIFDLSLSTRRSEKLDRSLLPAAVVASACARWPTANSKKIFDEAKQLGQRFYERIFFSLDRGKEGLLYRFVGSLAGVRSIADHFAARSAEKSRIEMHHAYRHLAFTKTKEQVEELAVTIGAVVYVDQLANLLKRNRNRELAKALFGFFHEHNRIFAGELSGLAEASPKAPKTWFPVAPTALFLERIASAMNEEIAYHEDFQALFSFVVGWSDLTRGRHMLNFPSQLLSIGNNINAWTTFSEDVSLLLTEKGKTLVAISLTKSIAEALEQDLVKEADWQNLANALRLAREGLCASAEENVEELGLMFHQSLCIEAAKIEQLLLDDKRSQIRARHPELVSRAEELFDHAFLIYGPEKYSKSFRALFSNLGLGSYVVRGIFDALSRRSTRAESFFEKQALAKGLLDWLSSNDTTENLDDDSESPSTTRLVKLLEQAGYKIDVSPISQEILTWANSILESSKKDGPHFNFPDDQSPASRIIAAMTTNPVAQMYRSLHFFSSRGGPSLAELKAIWPKYNEQGNAAYLARELRRAEFGEWLEISRQHMSEPSINWPRVSSLPALYEEFVSGTGLLKTYANYFKARGFEPNPLNSAFVALARLYPREYRAIWEEIFYKSDGREIVPIDQWTFKFIAKGFIERAFEGASADLVYRTHLWYIVNFGLASQSEFRAGKAAATAKLAAQALGNPSAQLEEVIKSHAIRNVNPKSIGAPYLTDIPANVKAAMILFYDLTLGGSKIFINSAHEEMLQVPSSAVWAASATASHPLNEGESVAVRAWKGMLTPSSKPLVLGPVVKEVREEIENIHRSSVAAHRSNYQAFLLSRTGQFIPKSSSGEIVGLREATPMDDVKQIDWKASARTDHRMLAREYRETEDRNLELIIDAEWLFDFSCKQVSFSRDRLKEIVRHLLYAEAENISASLRLICRTQLLHLDNIVKCRSVRNGTISGFDQARFEKDFFEMLGFLNQALGSEAMIYNGEGFPPVNPFALGDVCIRPNVLVVAAIASKNLAPAAGSLRELNTKGRRLRLLPPERRTSAAAPQAD